MSPVYRNVHFQAELPQGALPESFGILTAWNPQGQAAEPAVNQAANLALQETLRAKGNLHFPVTGGSADGTYQEVGFGMVASEIETLELARQFNQEAIYFVHRGQVNLVSCGTDPPELLALWRLMAPGAAAHPNFHFKGNLSLITQSPQPFLISSRCTPQQVLDSYAWARAQCDAGTTIISGFHSPVEQDVFNILRRRGANLIWVPGRDLPKVIPQPYQELLQQNRLLIATPFDFQKPSRPTRDTCHKRNQWIEALCQRGTLF